MENFEEIVAGNIKTITKLEEFVSLYFRKEQKIAELRELSKKIEDVKPLVEDCNKLVEKSYESMVAHAKKLINIMKSQQLIMVKLICEIKKKKQSNMKENLTPLGMASSLFTPILKTPNSLAVSNTPRMYLSHYKESPYVCRSRPIALQFIDFEAQITLEMFESIPKYMRGRISLDELTTFLDQVIVPCFSEKYQIFYKSRSSLKTPNDLERWKLYRDQANAFQSDKKFITQGDISHKIQRLIDKKMTAKISMLRHLGILKEEKRQTTVYYIWVDKNI